MVVVLELKFRVHFDVAARELTCWCGLHKPFGALWRHLISTLEVSGANFYYGGSLTNPERGVLIGMDDTPDDIGIVSLEYIDIVPTASSSTSAASSAVLAEESEPQRLSTSRSPRRRAAVPRLRRLQSPSCSPRRAAAPRPYSPRRPVSSPTNPQSSTRPSTAPFLQSEGLGN